MNTGRNPGLLGLTAGVGLGVLFALLGFAGVFPVPVGLGLGVIGVFVGAFLYLFFMRGTTVARIGYASLLFTLTLGLIIPILIVTQQQAQATQQSQIYDLSLQRGAALFGQYCSSCHGFQGQGIAGPKLNGNPDVSKLTNDDITRIISGGVPDPENLATFQMPAWSDAFGGPLTEQDIAYLLALIRSSDPQYLKTNNLPSTNGFSYVLASLTNPTQIAEYHNQANNPASKRPPDSQFMDQTGQADVSISAENNPPQGGGNWGWVVKGGQNWQRHHQRWHEGDLDQRIVRAAQRLQRAERQARWQVPIADLHGGRQLRVHLRYSRRVPLLLQSPPVYGRLDHRQVAEARQSPTRY